MNNPVVRYQHNPTLTDSVGFFDYCIPLINTGNQPVADSMQQYYMTGIHDYCIPKPKLTEKVLITSAFKSHQLQIRSLESKPIRPQSTDWIIGLLLICLIFFAWIQTNYNKRLRQIIKAVFQPYFINQLEREGNLFSERISIGLGIIYYCMTSMFVFLLAKSFGYIPSKLSDWLLTLLVFGGLVAYDLAKSAIISLLGFIFRTEEGSHEMKLNTLIFNHLIGITLFPITIIALFWQAKTALIIGLILISLLTLYRLFRLTTVGISTSKYNLFYLFLYLCTLEILPVLLLLRAIKIL